MKIRIFIVFIALTMRSHPLVAMQALMRTQERIADNRISAAREVQDLIKDIDQKLNGYLAGFSNINIKFSNQDVVTSEIKTVEANITGFKSIISNTISQFPANQQPLLNAALERFDKSIEKAKEAVQIAQKIWSGFDELTNEIGKINYNNLMTPAVEWRIKPTVDIAAKGKEIEEFAKNFPQQKKHLGFLETALTKLTNADKGVFILVHEDDLVAKRIGQVTAGFNLETWEGRGRRIMNALVEIKTTLRLANDFLKDDKTKNQYQYKLKVDFCNKLKDAYIKAFTEHGEAPTVGQDKKIYDEVLKMAQEIKP